MATVTAYVRSPISGHITGRTYYCTTPSDPYCYGNPSNGTHYPCHSGWYHPVDIGGTGTLYLYVNYPNVSSVITWVSLLCCSSSCDSSLRRMITVDLYGRSNGRCYIGSVAYGHVNTVYVSNGVLYNLSGSSLRLGTVTTVTGCGCSDGAHSHMEATGSTLSCIAPCCGATVSTSTNIYQFTWNDTCI